MVIRASNLVLHSNLLNLNSNQLNKRPKTSAKTPTMLRRSVFSALLVYQNIHCALSFPFKLNTPGIDSSLLGKRSRLEERQTTCSNNPVHKGAVPFNPEFPYTDAKNGLPGTQTPRLAVSKFPTITTSRIRLKRLAFQTSVDRALG